MELCKVIDYGTGDDLLFCSYHCAENYVVLENGEVADIEVLDPTDKDDALFIDECTPSGCDRCQKTIEKPEATT